MSRRQPAVARAEAELRTSLGQADLGPLLESELEDDGSDNRSDLPAAYFDRLEDRQRLAESVTDDVNFPLTAPCIADDEAQRRGYLPFWHVEDRDIAVMKNSTWPWEAALAFIALQDIGEATKVIAAYRVWGGRILRNPQLPGQKMSLSAADTELRHALIVGLVKATGVSDGRRLSIEKREWEDLDWLKTGNGECLEFNTLRSFGEDKFVRVSFIAREVQKQWRDPNIASSSSSRRTTPGRPPGTGKELADNELMPKLHELIAGGMGRKEAYLKIAESDSGNATIESKAKRIERRYKAWENKGV